MPITFAHPAAVLPLKPHLGKYGILSALVLGSIAPDMVYFLPFSISRLDSHGLVGLFWFCLPMGMVSYVTFHHFMKKPLIDLAPPLLAQRIASFPPITYSRQHVGAIVISTFLGAVTHLGWDSFTHEGTLMVRSFGWLKMSLFAMGDYQFYVFNILQYASSILGVLALVYCGLKWWRINAPMQEFPGRVLHQWEVIAFIFLLLVGPPLYGTLKALAVYPMATITPGLWGLHILLGTFLIKGIAALIFLLLAYSTVWHLLWFLRKTRRHCYF